MKISKLNKLLNLIKGSYFKYCIFVFPFLIVSCEKDYAPDQLLDTITAPQQVQNKMLDGITEEADVTSAKLQKNVIVLDEEANRQMTSYTGDKIEFISHASVNDIEVGSVLNSAPSTLAKYGLLVKVVNKEVRNGKIILQVEPGDFDDLFEEADFSFNLQKDVALQKGANKSKPDFGYDFNFGLEVGASAARNIDVQMGGRLDFSFDLDLNGFGTSDNELYARMNLSFDRNIDDPDFAINLGRSFELLVIDDRDLTVITLIVAGAPVPITISVDIGAEFEYDYGIAPGSIGWDLHGDFGFEGASLGGINQYENNWNTIQIDRKVQIENVIDFTATIKPLVKFKATPFKPILEIGDAVFFIYVEGSLAISLGYDRTTSCITAEPAIGIEGGFAGDFHSIDYELSTSAEFPISNFNKELWCFGPQTYENVGFRSVTDGEYLVFSDNGNSSGSTSDYKSYAHCNRGAFGDWERFNLIKDGDGTFAIQSRVNGKYADVLRSSAGSDYYRIRFDSDDPNRNDCRFIIEDHPDGNGIKAIKSVATDLYLACEGPNEDSNDALYVRPNRTSAGPWERWNIINADL